MAETTSTFEASDPRIAAALERLGSLLVPGERLEAHAVQMRLFALARPRLILAATTGRFIAMHRELFGGYQIRDVRWQDLKDARLKVGVLSAEITIFSLGSQDLATGTVATSVYGGLRKDQAQDVYRICQAREQQWREKRRMRELEELRAKSGGIHLGDAGRAAGVPAAAGSVLEDPVARLARAKEMLDKGLISDTEYESLKARIVESL